MNVECVAITIAMLQDSVSNGRDMMSVDCVAFTIVMLHQWMTDHKFIVRNPLWNVNLVTFIILWILSWYKGEQQELSNITVWPYQQPVKVDIEECVCFYKMRE